ncbi:CPBP family intramembrane glutamic endopeptidase [Leucobacter luti]|uniref:CAAX prenyl protease 2/Lysostaphin resistance protein A-like domain-containing protein n=1 Tax=Leucobacter luti TaxID=340320 RepID=A0A4Q7TPB4_9MICO|nr:CPBP family intramembrane glutamic endopeptidase [Leucobacter luti]MBL3700039.1 CPBP family intramembrane metalloprotease [Leucobacter luti]RZT62644.1 hypothetical protein EV139_2341 [Leucobacter luti]
MDTRTLPAPANGMLRARRPTGIVMALVVFALAGVMQTVFTVVCAHLANAGSSSPSGSLAEMVAAFSATPLGVVMSLLSFTAALGVVWAWVRFKERRPFASLGFERRAAAPRLALRGAGIGALMLTVCALVPVAAGQTRISWAAPDGASLLFIGIMLLGFIVQGSTEEILTRGFLTQAVARRWGLVAAVIVQAVFFAAIHGANPGMSVLPIVNLLLFAVFASFMSLAEGSLWGVCAMHGVWNWAQGNFFGIAVSGSKAQDSVLTTTPVQGANELITGGSFGAEGSLITTAVLLIGAGIAYRAWRGRAKTTAV